MRQFGVRNYEFDIETGEASFLPRVGEPVGQSAFGEAVEQAGFELLGSELRLRGTLGQETDEGGQERHMLSLATTGQPIELLAGQEDQERAAYLALTAWESAADQLVTVRGRPQAQASPSAGLIVREFDVVR